MEEGTSDALDSIDDSIDEPTGGINDDSFQANNLDRGGGGNDDNSATPAVPRQVPRRTARASKKPSWMTSGEYVMAAPTRDAPDWIGKANYLQFISETAPDDMKGKIFDALLSVVTQQK